MVSTLLEADVVNVHRVLELCLKSEITLKVYFMRTVAIAKIIGYTFAGLSVTTALIRDGLTIKLTIELS